MNIFLLFGMPNAGEMFLSVLILIGIPYGIFKAGVWYGTTKEIQRQNNQRDKKNPNKQN